MKTTKILISAFVLSIILTALSPAAYAIGVTPLRAFYKAAPGETVEGSVIAQNTTDTQQVVSLTKADFMVKEDESMQFIPEVKEDNMYSMQNWIEFEKNDVLTEPNGGAEMKYKITIPKDAASHAYYAAIFVQGKPPTAGAGAVSVGASVAHLVLLEVTGDLKASLEYKRFDMKKTEVNEGEIPKDEAQFKTVVFNSGNTHIAPAGSVKIYDSARAAKEDILLNKDQYNAMPERSKTITNRFDYSKYEAGQYYAELNMTGGETNTFEAYMPFTVNADRTLTIGETKTGKLPAEAEIIPTPAEAGAPLITLLPDWAPWAIGGGAGLIFVFGLVAYLLRKRKNNK
jgi:hypothetical protein